MKSYILITVLAAATAIMALPTGAGPDVCGPNSNCEIKEVDGEIAYVFKEGMGPGSSDYQKRFVALPEGSLARRAEIKTTLYISKQKMEWGCRASVYNAVANTIENKCHGDVGTCETWSKSTFPVQWVKKSGHGIPVERELGINVDGVYPDTAARDNLKQAILATINYDTTEERNIRWESASKSQNLGGLCPMKLFANSVAVTRFENGNMKDNMKFEAKMGDNEDFCLVKDVVDSVVGSVNGIAGGFFGAVSAISGACQ